MSMHFAPQWNKPIKPSGSAVTPTSEFPPASTTTATNVTSSVKPPRPLSVNTVNPPPSNVPFPALSHNGPSSHGSLSSQPQSATLSYSRATHTPVTPNFPRDGSYSPSGEMNGHGTANPHPFRYSKEAILGLWDEKKVKERPIELVDIGSAGEVLVSNSVVKPVGLRDLSEIEKKLLSTSIHPAIQPRRQPNGPPDTSGGTPQARRTMGQPAVREPGSAAAAVRNGAMGGFGRGEGGAFGSVGRTGVIGGGSSTTGLSGEGKAPGALGGGFGGIARRTSRRTESGDVTGAWKPTRTTSGSFEGVLGFGSGGGGGTSTSSAPQQPPNNAPDSENQDAPVSSGATEGSTQAGSVTGVNKEPETFGSGGGPGWGTGQKKWRIAAGLAAPDTTKELNIPVLSELRSDSVQAAAPETPLPEREAMLTEPGTPAPPASASPPRPTGDSAPPNQAPKEDLGAVQWYYRDPGGQEQGPFSGTQMHDWYSHSYFTDDLPLRRASETSFHSLAELKANTGNAVQPFLAPVRPRNLPPNLPIPFNNHLLRPSQPSVNGTADQFRDMNLSPNLVQPQRTSPYNHPDPNDPAVLSRSPYQPQYPSPNAQPSFVQSPPQPGASPWDGGIRQPSNPVNHFGSIGMQSPATLARGDPFNQQMPQRQPSLQAYPERPGSQNAYPEFFSPSAGVGALPASPWGMPQQPPQQPQQNVPFQHAPQAIPPPSAWQQPLTQQSQPVQAQLVDMTSQQEPPQDLPEPELPDIEKLVDEADDDVELPTQDDEVPPVEDTVPVEKASAPAQTARVDEAPAVAPSSTQPTVGEEASRDRKGSTSVTTPASATSSGRLPPAPASLPAKPVAAPKPSTPTTAEKASPAQAQPSPEKPNNLPSRPAPWAAPDSNNSRSGGLSLREIQEAEAKEAEARRVPRSALTSPTATTPAGGSSGPEEKIQNMSWGLPSSQKNTQSTTPTPTAATASAPVWGGGDAAPKKTLKQIQEEEEKRKAKAMQATQAARPSSANGVTASSTGTRRGYADLAASSQPASSGAGWTTVGASGKSSAAASPSTTTTAVRPASIPAKPMSSIPAKPATVSTTPAKAKTNGSTNLDEVGPSIEFIKWTKTALTGLKINVDEFIQMLLAFPVDPPASSRPDVLEIISDSVYANSSTLDGRRFAQEFFTRRKADAQRPRTAGVNGSGGGNIVKSASAQGSSLADVVKSVPKKSDDAGFRVVKAKGKKKN